MTAPNIPTPRTDAQFTPVVRRYLTPFEEGYNEGISKRCSPTANHYVKGNYGFTSKEHDAWNEGFAFGMRHLEFARTLERENVVLRAVFEAASKGQDDYKNYRPSLYQTDASDGDSRQERLKKNIERLENALIAAHKALTPPTTI